MLSLLYMKNGETVGFLDESIPLGFLVNGIRGAQETIRAGLEDGSLAPHIGVFADGCLNLIEDRLRELGEKDDLTTPKTPADLLDEALLAGGELGLADARQVPLHEEGLRVLEEHLVAASSAYAANRAARRG